MVIGKSTEISEKKKRKVMLVIIADWLNQTTLWELSNASTHGNAEVQENVKEEDGAQASMAVKELHSLSKPLDYYQTID
jgi:hypothetical protein